MVLAQGLGFVDPEHCAAWASGAAGVVGGALHALSATPLSSYLREGKTADLFRGLQYTLLRDTVGFGLYFGSYTVLRRLGLGACLDVLPLEPNERPKTRSLGPVGTIDVSDRLLRSLVVTAVAGGGAGLCTYLWRGPVDTLWEISRGWEEKHVALFSLRKFVFSAGGARAILSGTLTFSVYEAVASWVSEESDSALR